MKRIIAWSVCGTVLLVACPSLVVADEAQPTPDAALRRLKEGNARFTADQSTGKNRDAKRRAELAKGQRPFAVILACADSRVTPELIFDQGLGDVFVLRVAGNVTNPDIVGSIEYAVGSLKVPLVVVLGHESCGAVVAAIEGKPFEGNLGKLIARVHPGENLPKDPKAALEAGIKANVLHHAKELRKQSKVVEEFAAGGRVKIVAGVYSLKSGKVNWLESRSNERR